MRHAALCCLVLVFASAASAQDAARVKEVQVKLAKARQVVATLEQELAGLLLKSKGTRVKAAAPRLFELGDLVRLDVTPGGVAGELMVSEVLDAKTLIVYLREDRAAPFIVRGHPTKSTADGRVIEIPGVWRVATTVRQDGRTLFVVEPIGSPAKK